MDGTVRVIDDELSVGDASDELELKLELESMDENMLDKD